MFWRITHDLIADYRDDSDKGYGKGEPNPSGGEILYFALYDDDGELYYRGICDREALNRDTHPNGLYGAYEWAMHNAGCTDLQVNGESIYG